MKSQQRARHRRWFLLTLPLAVILLFSQHVSGQPVPAPTSAPAGRDVSAAGELKGRTVEAVRIVGNTQVSSAVILNLVRTKEGDKFDPATVVEDYQRIYTLKKFSNVEARVEPTSTGVVVVFEVTEQRQITDIRYKGNTDITTEDIRNVVDIKKGEAIDRFRINIARQAIEKLYHDRNFPFAHVSISDDDLAQTGTLTFTIVQGPLVRIRKVDFIGNNTFSTWKLKDQIQTAYWIWIFRPGTFDPDQVEEDVASIRKFYQDKGFFDARVGRKLIFSPDQSELQVTFVIDEGVRYKIDRVIFQGNSSVSDAELRKNMKLLEGQPYDNEVLQRDKRAIVKSYSPFGFIYEEEPGVEPNPDYLRIDSKPIFKQEKGHIDLVYDIGEGRRFYIGRILVKGNDKTQDKVVLREMHVSPGQLYNSAEIEDATDRLRGTPYFSAINVTPIGDDPNSRDLLVEVSEQRTASVQAGVGINSNGGVGGDVAYEQKNFDIGNPPGTLGDLFSDRAFTGAGQDFRASFDPGTVSTNATISFTEPYLFDQPYSFGSQLYLRNIIREEYTDRRLGGRITFGKRFNYIYSAAISLRAEDVKIYAIQQSATTQPAAAIEDNAGHHTLTSAAFQLRRDTTNHGPLQYKGDNAVVGVEQYGALGGQVFFTRLTSSLDDYTTLNEDLLDRRVVLDLHGDFGYDFTNAPVYERFYGGGIGSVRGFEYRGISPRGLSNTGAFTDDQVGGNFQITGGPELSFPLAEDILRGVLFIDAGDVEKDFQVHVVRVSTGFGFRLVIPFFGQVPLALDFGFPIVEAKHDNRQLVSFSLGISR